ncbi:unnamed protein product, partial [Meganyctiphanes norvegica]
KNGRVSDGGVFENTNFARCLEAKTLNIPKATPLPGSDTPVPFVFVADDAFALTEHMMKPYPNTGLGIDKHIFNYRVSRSRQTVECAFGQMSSRFRVLAGRMELDPEPASLITMTCCYLHNFLTKKRVRAYLDNASDRPNEHFYPLGPDHNGIPGNYAKTVRDRFCTYFNNEGSLVWQEARVRQGRS